MAGMTQVPALQKTIGPVQLAVFGFGSVVGTAWVVMLGGFLAHAGPVGAMAGIALGGTAMALIAAMYAELGSRFPQTGGEVTYINAVFGKRAGFVVGWILTLAYLSNLIFEGIALEWLAEILWPALTGPKLYMIFGQSVEAGGLVLAMTAGVAIAALNYRGAKSLVRFQSVLTVFFLAIVFVAVGVEFHSGSALNMYPLWRAADGGSWLVGAAWVFGSAPMIFNSFQSVLHAIEERSPSTSKELVVRLCVGTVGAAILFYLLVVLAAVRATPWLGLAAGSLPAVDALASLPGGQSLTTALLLALIASLLKAWNSVFMTSVRLLFAQARAGMIPAHFASVNPNTGAPGKAVVAVAMFNMVGIFLGKGLLEPIVNIMSVCIASIYVLVCIGALTMRRRDPAHAGFQVRGGLPVGILAIAGAGGMVVFALLQPAATSGAGAFKWALLIIWLLIGFGFYLARNRAAVSVSTARRTSQFGP